MATDPLGENIYQHPDCFLEYEDTQLSKTKKEMEKMQNIYTEFPALLLALYFENETGIDFRKIEEEKNLKETEEEKIKKFINLVTDIREKLKTIKTKAAEKNKVDINSKRTEEENKFFFKERFGRERFGQEFSRLINCAEKLENKLE
ncbi:MAG: hypothetical protein AAB530_01245 [Patescibacteria group bacterium]